MNVKNNVSLAQYCNFEIGGSGKKLITAASAFELADVVFNLEINKESYKVFAGGSNVVFPDKGITETLVQAAGGCININEEEILLTIDSGVLLKDVVKKAIELGWEGVENLSGIPGTIGGAVCGNAGAYGTELKNLVEAVEIYSKGKRKWLSNAECQFGYRTSLFKHLNQSSGYVILRVKLKLAGKSNSQELSRKSQNIIQIREQKYPKGLKCPGSYFKNLLVSELSCEQLEKIPKEKQVYGKISAGFLLEKVGAKEMQVGGIKVAPYHANLIYNAGNGTADQVKELAEKLRRLVFIKFKIKLEEEVLYF